MSGSPESPCWSQSLESTAGYSSKRLLEYSYKSKWSLIEKQLQSGNLSCTLHLGIYPILIGHTIIGENIKQVKSRLQSERIWRLSWHTKYTSKMATQYPKITMLLPYRCLMAIQACTGLPLQYITCPIIYNISVMALRDIEQQLSTRINSDSPTKYDIDFFKRKVNRLENDCNSLQEDLNKARIRLRRAEDYELKYELILKQNTYLQNQLDKKEKDLTHKKTELENLRNTQSQKTTVVEDWSKERLELQREIQKWKVKAEEAEEKRIAFMLEGREKADLNQKREMEGLRKEFLEKEEGYQFQIRQLKKTLSEKENIEGVIQGRVEKVRNQKNEQIRRLQEFIEKQRIASDEAYKEKSEQLDKFRDKFQKIFNFQLENLKKSVDDQDELFSIELNGFKEMIAIKNDEIAKLLDRLRKEAYEHHKEKQGQDRQIAMLREKIYTIQRENELEIINIKERMTKLQAADIEAIEKRYTSIVDGLKGDRKDVERQLKEKDKQVEGEKRELERLKHEMHDRLKERDTRIEHLQERIKEQSEMTDNEIKNLHQSFHQIESEKQLMTSEYQTNVGFLNQQLAKQTVKNETLNTTVKGLHEEIVRIKREYTELIQDIENRWKEERKQYDEQRQNEREKIEKLQDEVRDRDRQYKIKEKHLERLREKQEREKNKLQFIIEEMQRDTERLNNYIKQLDESLKRELKKNQMSTLDTGGIRRQLNGELQRQKAEIEVIKRLEIDQMRKKMEIQLTKLMGENEKLQNGLLEKTLALESLEDQFKKLEHINKNIDRINKEKLIQYEKKMATLNSEINVTQTLYQQFLEAKAREGKANA